MGKESTDDDADDSGVFIAVAMSALHVLRWYFPSLSFLVHMSLRYFHSFTVSQFQFHIEKLEVKYWDGSRICRQLE